MQTGVQPNGFQSTTIPRYHRLTITTSGAKTLLSYPMQPAISKAPANQTPEQDLDDVDRKCFNHPNHARHFISELMIQSARTTVQPQKKSLCRRGMVFSMTTAPVFVVR
jgi:hypothetical protein